MPIHLFWGDNASAIDRAIESLSLQILDPNWSTINLSRFDGSDQTEVIRALEEARTPPFGNGGRVILLKRSPIFNGCSNQIANQFEELINLIPKQVNLILQNENKPDKRLKTTKKFQELIDLKLAFEKSFKRPAILQKRNPIRIQINRKSSQKKWSSLFRPGLQLIL